MKKWIVLLGGAALAGAMFIPVGGGSAAADAARAPARATDAIDLSTFSDQKPTQPLALVVIHHSCGGQMLAAPGPEMESAKCVYDAHPNGGGLRKLLEEQGYAVHEASYGSEIGDKTDLFDWPPKFQTKMDKILRVKRNDELLPEGQINQVVVFKSCFPNNEFVGQGTPPGNPAGPELTVANAKAALSAVLPELEKHPKTLFLYVTAPANAPNAPPEPAWRWLAKTVLGKAHNREVVAKQAALARDFNQWVVSKDGWLKDYRLKNVAVFDYYGALTDGRSGLSAYATDAGRDSHPSREGNERAAKQLVPLLNRAVRRAGLSD
jgi:hypothetical protein